MKVLFLPDYRRGNPYQSELMRALEAEGILVFFGDKSAAFPFLSAIQQHGRCDIIHIHWTAPFMVRRSLLLTLIIGMRTLFELCVLRMIGTKIVWTVHNLQEHERRYPRIERQLTRILSNFSHAIVVHCEAAGHAVVDFLKLPPKTIARIHTVPHGDFMAAYPNRISRTAARKELGLAEDERVFLYLGAVREYKGIPELLRAFKQLEDPRCRLVVAGRAGSVRLQEDIDRIAKDDDRVRIDWGFVPDHRVQVYMNAGNVVVLPYTDILTSGAVVLAMTFGRAVIAPRMGCLTETLNGVDACLYNPHDPEGLVGALRRSLSMDLDALGDEGFTIVKRTSWRIAAEQLASVYMSALSGNDR